MHLKHLLIVFVAGLFSIVALSGCKGNEAVDELEKLKNKACSCEGDAECTEEAVKMAAAWTEEYKDARGGDQEKAEKLAGEIAACNLPVALELAKAAE